MADREQLHPTAFEAIKNMYNSPIFHPTSCATIPPALSAIPQVPSPRTYSFCRNALPNVNNPYVARTERTMGTGLRRRMARGIAEPPRTSDARRLSSMPYGSLLEMR
jgi:hypothetical protein